MDNQDGINWWQFFDGSVSVSASMFASVLISKCVLCGGLPVIAFLKALTTQDDGVIIVASMLLFPMTLTLYGGINLYFAAKAAADRRSREKIKQEREKARKELADRIINNLRDEKELTPEIVQKIVEESLKD